MSVRCPTAERHSRWQPRSLGRRRSDARAGSRSLGNAETVELPTPAARFLALADRDLLAGMRCSTGAWFEDDVETFIRTRLADYHDWRRVHTDHTIVGLELDDLGLVAVGSHESDFVRDVGQVVTSTYLECAAVRTDLQGAVLAEVDPLDDDDRPVTLGRFLLEVLLSDIAGRERAPIVRAVVARENTRSLRLCARIGLTDERDDPDERFVQRLGRIAA
jgi:hypothetical protein